MSVTPCESNDNFDLLGLSDSLGVSTRQNSVGGSGCNDATSTSTTDATPVAVQGTEPEESPTFTASSVVTFLSCNTTDALELTKYNNIERIELAYDYDIHTTNEADPSFSVGVFELDMLKAVADEFGLSSCAFGRRSLRNGRRKLNVNSTTGASSSVVGIGSNPGDVFDTTRYCTETTVSTNEPSTCTPMIGFMTAWVDKTSGAGLAKRNIYTAIEKYSKSYVTDEGVLAVSYIGTRPAMIVSSAELDFLNESSAPGALAGIAVASVLALLAAIALVRTKCRYRNKEVKRSEKLDGSTNNAPVVGGGYDDDDGALVMVMDDDSTISVTTECCTVDETIGSSVKNPSDGSSRGDDGAPEDEGFELSYDEVINMQDIHL